MTYSAEIEHSMRMFYNSLTEKDRRRYAAIEAAKLGHGGIEYVATVLSCDPKTIRHGQQELDHLPTAPGWPATSAESRALSTNSFATNNGSMLAGTPARCGRVARLV